MTPRSGYISELRKWRLRGGDWLPEIAEILLPLMESKLALGISIIIHDLVLNWTREKRTLHTILELPRSSYICQQL
jgi:hypothetical protein